MDREQAEAIERAVAGLSPDVRRFLHLVRVEGMTLKNAAEIMGPSHAAVRKIYGRALARLAAQAREGQEEPTDE